jgi:hypothetical protein
MNDDKSPQIKITGKIPHLKENPFIFRRLSMREFETLLIILKHEGIEQPILKILIDQEFKYESQTKAYDHINILCKQYLKTKDGKRIANPKWCATKKKTKEKGKNVTRIYVRPSIRKKYQKYMLPTFSNLDEILKEIIKEYIEGIKEEDKVRKKFKSYTDTIIRALNKLILESTGKNLTTERFQKKIFDTIMKYYRSEILILDFLIFIFFL